MFSLNVLANVGERVGKVVAHPALVVALAYVPS
jgi:hypothetical protein